MGTYSFERETHVPSFGGGMFVRAGDVYSFVRETCIHSFGRRVFIRSEDVYSFGRETFIPRTGAHVPLGLVCRCHSGEWVGATRASVWVPPERVCGADPSESASLIRADRYERQGETAVRIE